MIRDNVVSQLVKTGKWSEGTARLFERANHRCEYCGFDLLASVDAFKLLQVDHIVPISKSGDPEDFNNLAIACMHCNWHLKRAWDPRKSAGENASRAELIEAVKNYVNTVRELRESDLQAFRRIVGYGSHDT